MLNKLTFEVSAICNAQCPYCVTGAKINVEVPESESFLIPERAGSVLDYLFNIKIITSDTTIDLYNWGEPFLNPRLNEVLDEFAGRGLNFNMSTNGSVYRHLSPKTVAAVKQLYFSFPGFSQSSYSRIHGFAFNQIKNNVESLVQDIQTANPQAQLIMSFHVYQFNIGELASAHEWCAKRGIVFFPYAAYWNGYELARRYKLGLEKDNRDLILGYEEGIIERYKNGTYRCPQWDTLTLDQNGRVVLCCVMDTSNPDCVFKNVQEGTAEEIQKWKESRPVCQECMRLGISQWIFKGVIHNWDPIFNNNKAQIIKLEQCKYESTVSWRITKPLRIAGKILGLRRKNIEG
jgi:MoaA/NifB/PqqE/SkfB family radical SAM enzyme